jgi:serine/threonine protein kinase
MISVKTPRLEAIRNIVARQPRQFSPPENGEVIINEDRRYFIGGPIGRGGFGMVYECTDDWGNPLVAKILMPRRQSYRELKEVWQDELRKLVVMRHPNITFVYDAFEHKDTFYLIIERCNFPLTNLITRAHLDPDRWIPYVARDVLQALDYIHASGYVHKDLHPGNVFVAEGRRKRMLVKEPFWQFKVGDLGLTKLESDIRVFETLLADWMRPPEAFDPVEFGDVGYLVDIYQTGLLLLALLLREIPYFTKDEILAGIPKILAHEHDSKYGPVIAKALRRHTSVRTPSALEFWREISAVSGEI